MASSKSTIVNFSLAVLVFLVILTSILLAESICHAYLPAEPNPSGNFRIIVEPATAIFASFLILLLFIRFRNLSGDREQEYRLRAHEDWERTFNTMPDFVSIHDNHFRVTKVNKALCEFLDKRPEEIIGKQCYQVFHNMNEPYENCPHRKTAELDHPVSEIITDPNIGVPLQVTCSPFWDDEGVFKGSLHIARVSEGMSGRKCGPGEIFPICASCKSIRDSDNEWLPLEDYFLRKHEFRFTHTLCRDCQHKLYPNFVRS